MELGANVLQLFPACLFFCFCCANRQTSYFLLWSLCFYFHLCFYRSDGWESLCFLFGTCQIPDRSFHYLLLWGLVLFFPALALVSLHCWRLPCYFSFCRRIFCLL